MTLRDSLDTRNNALNFVRLLLAGLVIVSHTWPLGGFGAEPRLGDLSLGTWAVAGFFAISGYLVTGSRMRLSLRQFMLRRALRIYPGLWACLIVVAFMFAPLTALETGVRFDSSNSSRFVWSNATTLLHHMRIDAELDGVPLRGSWDGSLWTLQFEVACYVLMGLVLCFGWARRDLTRTVVAVWVALTIFNVTCAQMGSVRGTTMPVDFLRFTAMPVDFFRFAAYFAAGSLLWSLGDTVRVNRRWVAGAAGAVAVFALAGVVDLWGALPLAYLVLAFGAWCPLLWGVRRDLSYGVYVYAFPVQQVLAAVRVQRFGPVVFMSAAVVMVVPLAWLSWTFIESPSLRLARRRSPEATGAGHVSEDGLEGRLSDLLRPVSRADLEPAADITGDEASTVARGNLDINRGHRPWT